MYYFLSLIIQGLYPNHFFPLYLVGIKERLFSSSLNCILSFWMSLRHETLHCLDIVHASHIDHA
jgi:hypothetical protein